MMATILVIEDSTVVRTLRRRMLQEAGYEVVEAHEGHEGLTVCQTRSVDLVITDLLMPGQEGLETIRQLRTLTPAPKIISRTREIRGRIADPANGLFLHC